MSKPPQAGRTASRKEDIASAATFVRNHRRRASDHDHLDSYLDTAVINTLLRQRDCAGLRFYLADSVDTGNPRKRKTHIIIMKVDAQGNDIKPTFKLNDNFSLGIGRERCPYNCDAQQRFYSY